MGFFDFIGKTVIVFLLVIGGLAYFGYLESNDIKEGVRDSNEYKMARPYVEEIVFDDLELRKFSALITESCPSGDKACHVNEIFRYVVDNYKYYSDTRNGESIQSPYNTMNIGGGDCEDLTILMNSLLENIGIKTYLVLTDTHAYGLVCGIDSQKLMEYSGKDTIKRFAEDYAISGGEVVIDGDEIYIKKSHNDVFVIEAHRIYYYGGEGEKVEYPFLSIIYDYSATFSSPVNIYAVPSKKDYNALRDRESFNSYTSCTGLNVLKSSNRCPMITNGGIVITNFNSRNSVVNLHLDIYRQYSSDELLKDMGITYYTIDEETCIVLDSTTGKNSYPGYAGEDLEGQKIAIDPVSKKIVYLK